MIIAMLTLFTGSVKLIYNFLITVHSLSPGPDLQELPLQTVVLNDYKLPEWEIFWVPGHLMGFSDEHDTVASHDDAVLRSSGTQI